MADDRPVAALTGLLLAGGRSRRMGMPKERLAVGGTALAVQGVRLLQGICAEVVVASGDGRRLADVLDGTGVRQVADPVGDAGPLAGIAAGLGIARHPLVAVLAVDLPDANAEVFRLLAAAWHDEPAIVPVVGGRLQPLHAVWAASAAGAVAGLLRAGRRSVVDAAGRLGARLVGPEVWGPADPGGRFARNVNRPQDLLG
jgi:molybdenum cofactor guanylyltransferase